MHCERTRSRNYRRAFSPRREGAGRQPSVLLDLETRTLFSAQIAVFGGLNPKNGITDGSTTPTVALTTDLGTDDVDNTTYTRDFYVLNAGDATLNLTGAGPIALSGDTTDFTITNQPLTSSIIVSSSGFFTVSFKPQSLGRHVATVSIPTNDPNHPDFTFEIAGTAVNPFTVTGGTEYAVNQPGVGAASATGDILSVSYTTTLFNGIVVEGVGTPATATFQLGAAGTIAGWNNGLIGMQSGEERTLIVPADQAYGSSGHGNIPANSALVYDVTLTQRISSNYVPHLYQDILGRSIDAGGLTYWDGQLASGVTPASVTAGFISSTEYRSIRINQVYQSVLGRSSDANGLNSWLAFMAGGGTIEQMEAQFYGSTEYYNDHGATPASYVQAMYTAVLARMPDANGEAYWTNQVSTGPSRSTIAFSLIKSTEASQRVVQRLYTTYLHRSADAGGLTYWTGQLTGGLSETNIIAGFLSAPEYFGA